MSGPTLAQIGRAVERHRTSADKTQELSAEVRRLIVAARRVLPAAEVAEVVGVSPGRIWNIWSGSA